MKISHTVLFFLLSAQLYAVPALQKRITVRMSDGTWQTVRFCGDENRSFYLSEDGFVVEPDEAGQVFRKTDLKPDNLPVLKPLTRATGIGDPDQAAMKAVGSPKVPVILVNFSDMKMSVADTDEKINTYYDLYCNGTRDGQLYTGAGSAGAVRDYFAQQSDSLFLPDFEVIGPVTLSKPMAYYGENSGSRKDIHFTEFCSEALQQAMSVAGDRWSDFDNDGNGTVDLAFFIYAGVPESDYGADPNTIWPKEMVSPTVIDDVTVSVMACCSELTKRNDKNVASGVGTMCHELSHAVGLPDEYDYNYVALGMSYWSLMDCGNYCVNGYVPCGLTAYQRDFLGWRPLETLNESRTVTIKPLEKGGKGYKVVNDANPDEYYILENRQDEGWDSGLASLGRGLLVTHVDYDYQKWVSNRLNSDAKHQRMSFIPANNLYIGQYNATSAEELKQALAGQAYPGNTQNTSLTDYTIPAATVFNGQYMGKPVTQIRQLDNGDIVFKFMPKGVLEKPDCEGVTISRDDETGDWVLNWNKVDYAEAYRMQIYSFYGQNNETLIVEEDSVRGTTYVINSDSWDQKTELTCLLTAVADQYEDSPTAECVLSLDVDAIKECQAVSEFVRVYNLQGVYLMSGTEEDCRKSLPPGLYIFRSENQTIKVRL